MFNIKFKGKYKNEKQLIENSKLYKNATMFEEEKTVTEAFKSGIKFALPGALLMIIIFIAVIAINHVKLNYNMLHLIISSASLMPLLYVHEIIHALTYPAKERKDIYSKPQEMALFVYSNAIVTKKRFITICLMPTLVLGIIPFIIVMLLINIIPITFVIDITYISIAMFISALGDFTNAYNAFKQVPKNGKVFNYGYHSYWLDK